MIPVPSEFDVYSRLIEFLSEHGWTIICASPPGGTNSRHRKCLLPRRDLKGADRGLRDEVDLTAHDGAIILIAECKSRLSESMLSLSSLDESDYDKLKRIANSFPVAQLARLLKQASGMQVPMLPSIALGLAVGLVDCIVPEDMSVFEFGYKGLRVYSAKPLTGRWAEFV